ncbi:hypothetical protein [Paenibacillus sp. FSL P2-0173]|uniref:hypothetical protein n=1 Tax=Paenibacillus sp. FSL P2-0173 TaxID=2921627 RepID=UPI0030F4BA36
MNERLPPPMLSVGPFGILAYVPKSVTLQQMDTPTFRMELPLGPSPDFSQYQLSSISGFAATTFSVVLPCASMGRLYRFQSSGSSIAIGCRKPDRLKFLSKGRYVEMSELSVPDYYRLYRDRDNMKKYFVLPAVYRIGFHAKEREENGRRTFLPGISAQAIIDPSTVLRSSVLFQVMLLPDLPLYIRQELEEKLRSFTEEPIVEYPGQQDMNYAVTIQEFKDISISKQGVAFYLTIPVTMERAILLRDSVSRTGAHGSIRFEFADGMFFESAVVLELSNMTGPWSTGPFEVTMATEEITLINKIKQPIQVKSIWCKYSQSGVSEVPAEFLLDPEHTPSQTIPMPATVIAAYPVYTLKDVSDNDPLIVSNYYLPELSTKIEFLDLIDHPTHQVEQIDISLRIQGNEAVFQVPLNGNPLAGTYTLGFPFSGFFQNPTVEIKISITLANSQLQSTQWITWSLPEKGTVVSLTWELFQQHVAPLPTPVP